MRSGQVSEEHQLTVLALRGEERVPCGLSWRRFRDRTYTIELDGPSGLLTGSGSDLFRALQEVRLALEPQGWLIAVQGARKDAYASGMLRDMVGAQRVYVVEPGRRAEREHLVDIFAEADPDALATVEQQHNYYREWRLSLMR